MTPNEVRADAENLSLALLEHSLALDSNRIIRRYDSGVEWVTWASTRDDSLPLYDEPTIEAYQRLLTERQYAVLLADFSLLQLSFAFERGILTRQRFCFYPCPVLLDREDVEMFGIVDCIEALTAQELVQRTRLDAPVRVDFDRDASGPGHPAAHLTLSRDSCRIPLYGPLSVGHFVHFVFSNFYPEWWGDHEFIRSWPRVWLPRTISEDERLQLHVECRQSFLSRLLRRAGA